MMGVISRGERERDGKDYEREGEGPVFYFVFVAGCYYKSTQASRSDKAGGLPACLVGTSNLCLYLSGTFQAPPVEDISFRIMSCPEDYCNASAEFRALLAFLGTSAMLQLLWNLSHQPRG